MWVFGTLFAIVIAARLGVLYHQRALFDGYDWASKWKFILLAMVLYITGQIIAALVWSDIMKRLGSNVTLLSHIQYYCIGRLSRRIIPGKIWFLASRGYLYKQDGDSFRLVAIASGVEFSITLLSGILVTIFTVGYTFLDLSNPLYYTICITIIGLSALCIHPKTIAYLMGRTGLAYTPNLSYKTVIKWLINYIILRLLGGLMLYLIANVVTEIPLIYLGHIIGSWCLISVFSQITIGIPTNLGVNDVGLSLLLMPILSGSLAAVVAVLFYLLLFLYELIGAAIIMTTVWQGKKWLSQS